MLTKAQIISANDLPTEVVEVPEWGGSVTVRGLTAAEFCEYRMSQRRVNAAGDEVFNWQNFNARLVAMTVIDDAGKPMFEEAEIKMLAGKSAVAVHRVFAVAQRLSGLGGDAEATTEKNCE